MDLKVFSIDKDLTSMRSERVGGLRIGIKGWQN